MVLFYFILLLAAVAAYRIYYLKKKTLKMQSDNEDVVSVDIGGKNKVLRRGDIQHYSNASKKFRKDSDRKWKSAINTKNIIPVISYQDGSELGYIKYTEAVELVRQGKGKIEDGRYHENKP